ncbi:hypothetical protein LY90DRAFT_673893 [Neocallimastix californiae]|uniref:Uncharacterized protein n=1 Tax=Neocallimastix californiae TaxID=1754190 RepID=A0A1Y2B6V0_9FUNG|nr:hypothetical protein LY90DRAFT_673893 [Neocallimastix californiae]|eukprot:ORY29835.1 hypothetical protein LY90DRAFT_673893 [Neocallimastix californiae]
MELDSHYYYNKTQYSYNELYQINQSNKEQFKKICNEFCICNKEYCYKVEELGARVVYPVHDESVRDDEELWENLKKQRLILTTFYEKDIEKPDIINNTYVEEICDYDTECFSKKCKNKVCISDINYPIYYCQLDGCGKGLNEYCNEGECAIYLDCHPDLNICKDNLKYFDLKNKI